KTVVLGDGVETIESSAFYGCTGLKGLTFGKGVKTIESSAFSNCTGLQNVSLPNTVKTIAWDAFSGCTGLKTIEIPYGVASIGGLAFSGCTSLQSIDLPDSVYEIGSEAFRGCCSATSLHIPALLGGIVYSTFRGCSGIASVTIPDNVASIGEYAFADCTNLVDVTISKNVVSIGDGAFGRTFYNSSGCGCQNLKSVIFRGDAPTMGGGVFYAHPDCTAYVRRDSTGWDVDIPGVWQGIKIAYVDTIAIPHNVIFDARGGSFVSGTRQRRVNEGNQLGELPVVSREDYDFAGWFTKTNGGSRVTSATVCDGEMTCYAQWTLMPPPESLDFECPSTISAGGSQTLSAKATLEGGSVRDVVASWQLVSGGEFASISSDGLFKAYGTVVERTVTVKASYTARGNTVTESKTIRITPREIYVDFYGNGGTPSAVYDVFTVYGTYGNLPTASRGGYSFDGWYTKAEGGSKVTVDSMVTDTDRLYAHWIDLAPTALSVSGETSVAAGTTSPYSAEATLSDGFQKNVPAVWSVVGGSDFGSISSNGLFKAAETPVAGEVVLKAVYSASGAEASATATVWVATRTVAVAFHGNGGTVSSNAVNYTIYGRYGGFPAVERPDVAFVGWFTAAEGGDCVDADSKVTGETKALYAHWRKYRPLAVVIDGSDSVAAGEGVRLASSVAMDSGATNAVDVTWEIVSGAEFASIGDDGVLTAVQTTKTGEIVVRAAYEAEGEKLVATKTIRLENKVVVVSFDGNGGDSPNASSYVVYGTYGELPASKRPGHTFAGWWTEAEGGVGVLAQTVVGEDVTKLFAHWTPCVLTFNANGGRGSMSPQSFAQEGTQPLAINEFIRTGYVFQGWALTSNGDVVWKDGEIVTPNAPCTLYAIWKLTFYTITYSKGGYGYGYAQLTAKKKHGEGTYLRGLTFTRDGYTQTGWTTSEGGPLVYGLKALYTEDRDVVLYPYWEENAPSFDPGPTQDPEPSPNPMPEPEPEQETEEVYELCESIVGSAPTLAASEYNGYLVDAKGNVKGTIQVKVGKPGKKDGKASVKATVAVGAKKVTLNATERGKAEIKADGPTTVALVGKGAEACEITIGAEGLSGTYGAYVIDGARNIFSSKDKVEQIEANKLADGLIGSYNLVWNGGVASVTIGKKGKAKMAATLEGGKKVTATAALLIGEEWFCVPVSAPKANLSLVVWLPAVAGRAPHVAGLGDDAVIGRPAKLAAGAKFRMDAAAFEAVLGQSALPYLPDGASVGLVGTKWVVANGAKAGKLTMKNGVLDASKAGENPAGLKLTYSAKDGSFKGSFKAYAVVGGKLKATTVNVSGVMIGSKGYGSASIKKLGSCPVTIE
ncbi:MAG: leucine-rich repeat protein, partial [Kiritimatiellae bacterium]|nr:leucine-rich repeat protein [Kiritimatiellia bacterium]